MFKLPPKEIPYTDLNQDGSVSVERVEFSPTPLVYLEGHPFPMKGLPTMELISNINQVKKLLKRGRVIRAYKILRRYPLNRMCPTAQEVHKVSILLAHILEHDQAYRFRFQDVMSETTKEELLAHPYTETKRLVNLYLERENPLMRKMLVLKWLPIFAPLFVWRLKHLDFSRLQYDEGDRYWASQRNDYRHFGRDRGELWNSHGTMLKPMVELK